MRTKNVRAGGGGIKKPAPSGEDPALKAVLTEMENCVERGQFACVGELAGFVVSGKELEADRPTMDLHLPGGETRIVPVPEAVVAAYRRAAHA